VYLAMTTTPPARKVCTACDEEKLVDEFYYDNYHGRHKARCKPCYDGIAEDRKKTRAVEARIDEFEDFAAWGTELQRAAVEALVRTRSVTSAAAEIKLTPAQLRALLSELERRAASRGWSPGADMVKPTAEGYHVKGTSTYYNKDGTIRGQWVKTNKDPEHRLEQLFQAVADLAEPFRGLHDPVAPPEDTDADLLCVYPMGDPHLGMHSWSRETGQDFNLKIAEASLVAAVDHLVNLAPRAKEALILNLGDFFHSDSQENRTARSGHQLDVDSRWSKVLGIGIRAMRRVIDRALEKHERVTVVCEIGNHDDHSSIMLALCLANYYEREPRVVIDTSPAKFHWYRFGANLIGTTHGDTVKADKLAGVMATDRAKDWGETLHRYWYTGHVHHDSLKEYPGCVVETFRTLAARDAWHSAAGYRSGRDMKLDVLHRTHGRINRHVVGIQQLIQESPK
jgi:hypothetical protein